MTVVGVIFLILVIAAVVLAILSKSLNSINKNLSQIAGAKDRCAYCKKKLKFTDGSFATVCPKCGREQPPPQTRIFKTPSQRRLGNSSAAVFSGCRYLGGFPNTRTSSQYIATLTISDTKMFIDLGQPDQWARMAWRHINRVSIQPMDNGSELTIGGSKMGTGSLFLPNTPPDTIWKALDQVQAFRGRIPAEIRQVIQ